MRERKTYRDYLRENGIPIRFDLQTAEGRAAFRDSAIPAYQALYEEFVFSPEDKVLEIGCHYGAFVKYLNEKGVVPDAIDLDPKKIEVLRGEQELRANFIASDATEILRNRMDQYDCAFMHFVLEHIRPDQVLDLLEAVQRSLRMGGRLCVTVPNMENPLNLRLRYMEPTHRTGFTTESLIWFFYRAGFDRILCKDPSRYDSQKRRRIERLFGFLSRLLEIRPFPGKFSETLFCQGTKLYPLEALEFGPYDA